MFAVPEDLNDENAYSTSVGKFETQKQYTWSYKAYTIGEGNIDVATAMLFKGVGGSGAVEDYTPFSVVKEFKWGADKDGDMRLRIRPQAPYKALTISSCSRMTLYSMP